MKKTRLLIIGASGHGKVVLEAALNAGNMKVLGFIDDTKEPGTIFCNHPTLGSVSELKNIVKKTKADAIAIAVGDNHQRYLVASKVRKMLPSISFPVIIHPNAYIALGTEIGEGSVILPGSIIGADSWIGNFCLVNTRSSLDHDTQMHHFASTAPGVTLGGNVEIGAFTAIGIGASVIQKIKIGEQSIIGAGAVVTKNVPKNVVAYGVPAKTIRKRKAGDKYI